MTLATEPPATAPTDDPGLIGLGSIVGVFSFKGEVRVHLHHREGDALRQWRPIQLHGPDGAVRQAKMRVRSGAGKRILGQIEGVTTEAGAQALVGWEIHIRRADLPQPDPDEYYVHDLIGLPVYDEEGAPLGTLEEVVPGHKDIWVIAPGADAPSADAEAEDGEVQFVVAEGDNIVSVDVPGRRLVVRRAALSG